MVSSPSTIPWARGRAGRLFEYLRELWRRREFAVALGLGNLKARNASTTLGLFWWIINPLLMGGVYFTVFGLLFGGSRPPDFLVYLMSGMFVFHFTSQSMSGGAHSILQNSRLLANLRFPRLILPISTLIESLVGFLASIVVLIAIAAVTGYGYFGPKLFLVFVVLPLQLVFNLGLAALIARLAVPFRDIGNLLPYLTRIWLYVTPIIWPVEFIDGLPEWTQRLVAANPMFHFVSVYRTALLGYPWSPLDLQLSTISALLVGVLGVALFVKHEGHMVRYL